MSEDITSFEYRHFADENGVEVHTGISFTYLTLEYAVEHVNDKQVDAVSRDDTRVEIWEVLHNEDDGVKEETLHHIRYLS